VSAPRRRWPRLPSACLGQARPAQAPPTFRSGVELITVDAVVLDRDGRPVSGLTREDFVVKEDGRPREIASFEAFVAGAPDAEDAEVPADVATNEPGTRGTGRAFAIVLDDVSLSPDQTAAARAGAVQFVERFTRERDLVTVTTTSGSAWWSARIPEGREDLLAVLARVRGGYSEVPVPERMSDYEAYWISHREDSPSATSLAPGSGVTLPTRATVTAELVPPGSIKERVKQRWQRANQCQPLYCDSAVRARASEIDRSRSTRVAAALASMRRALEALATVRGRKSLLFFSPGFLQDSGSGSRAVAAASREANTAIYFVDARGLVALPGWGSAADFGPPPDGRELAQVAFEETSVESAGAAGLATDTGGFAVRNSNDLSAGAWRVAAESRAFYLLGFYPPEGKADRQWRSLRVEVKRPGLTVRARRGYTMGSEMASLRPLKAGQPDPGPAADPAIARALDSAHDETAIPLRAIAYAGAAAGRRRPRLWPRARRGRGRRRWRGPARGQRPRPDARQWPGLPPGCRDHGDRGGRREPRLAHAHPRVRPAARRRPDPPRGPRPGERRDRVGRAAPGGPLPRRAARLDPVLTDLAPGQAPATGRSPRRRARVFPQRAACTASSRSGAARPVAPPRVAAGLRSIARRRSCARGGDADRPGPDGSVRWSAFRSRACRRAHELSSRRTRRP
jgi:VWFA-related protein